MNKVAGLLGVVFLLVAQAAVSAPVIIVIGDPEIAYYDRIFRTNISQLQEIAKQAMPETSVKEIEIERLFGLKRRIDLTVNPGDEIKGIVIYSYGTTQKIAFHHEQEYEAVSVADSLASALADRALANDFTVYFMADNAGSPESARLSFVEQFAARFIWRLKNRPQYPLNVTLLAHAGVVGVIQPAFPNSIEDFIARYAYWPEAHRLIDRLNIILTGTTFAVVGMAAYYYLEGRSNLGPGILGLLGTAVFSNFVYRVYSRQMRRLSVDYFGEVESSFGTCRDVLRATLLTRDR